MTGRRKWSDIRGKADPEVLEAARRKTEVMLAVMDLDELRRRRDLTQEELADRLERTQSNVSRTLRRRDLHVSTLRDVIEAMGGELTLVASFPDGDRVELRSMGEAEPAEEDGHQVAHG